MTIKVMMPLLFPEGDGGGGLADDLGEEITPIEDGGDDTNDDADDDSADDDTDNTDDSDDDDDDDESADDDTDDDDDDEDTDDDEEVQGKGKGKDKGKEAEQEEDPDADPKTVAGNTIKAINAKYPKLFKEHPELKASFFQAREFRGIFATPQDAAEASQIVQNFEFIQEEVAGGNPETILEFLDKSPDKIYRFGRKMLEGIYAKNQQLYAKITAPVLVSVIESMRAEAKTHNNQNLQRVADWMQKFTFGDSMPTIEKIAEDAGNPEVQKLQAQQYATFRDGVVEEANDNVANLIVNSLASLKDVSKGMKRTIVRDTYDLIMETLNGDKAHVGLMNSYWTKAKREGFTRQSGARIKTAYLDAVKKLLPAARERALKENGFNVKKLNSKNKNDKSSKIKMRKDDNQQGNGNRTRENNSRTPRGKKESEMSDLELMNHALGNK